MKQIAAFIAFAALVACAPRVANREEKISSAPFDRRAVPEGEGWSCLRTTKINMCVRERDECKRLLATFPRREIKVECFPRSSVAAFTYFSRKLDRVVFAAMPDIDECVDTSVSFLEQPSMFVMVSMCENVGATDASGRDIY